MGMTYTRSAKTCAAGSAHSARTDWSLSRPLRRVEFARNRNVTPLQADRRENPCRSRIMAKVRDKMLDAYGMYSPIQLQEMWLTEEYNSLHIEHR